jgi:uncharacterized membrane protein
MYSRPTAPANIGGVLDNIFKLYAAALPQCWPISLTSGLVALIPGIYIALKVGIDPTQMLGMVSSPAFWGSYLVLILISLMFSFAMLIRVAQVAEGEAGTTGGAIARAGALLPRAFGATLLFLLAYVGGALLLVVPGIIWSVSFILAGAFIVLEDAGAVESLSRSRRLVKGNWWRTFGILTIALIMAYVLLVTVQFTASFAAKLLSVDLVVSMIVTTVLGALLNVVVSPLYSASILGIYFDLKLRKEGDDLSARVASLDQAPAKV